MKRKNFGGLILAFACLASFASRAGAVRSGDQGIGVMIGNPSGLSYKMWLDENVAIDGALGADNGEFDAHATLLWHNFSWSHNLQDSSGFFDRINRHGDLPFYIGIGPRILFEKKTEYGIRFPLGLSFLPHNTPWEIFAEFAPVIRLTPSQGLNGDYAIGARYYFPAIHARVQ